MARSKPLCLVTGGAGFIGSHVAEGLLKRGCPVRILDNLSTGFLSNVSSLKGDVDFMRGDVRNPHHVSRAVKRVRYVFHLAANRAVLRSVENPLETHEVNVTGTLRLLHASREAKVNRFIFTSSSAVYGDTKSFPIKETDLPQPMSPYGASKLMAEHYCRIFSHLYGLSTISLRYFNVFGPRQHPESRYSAAIPIFIACLLKGRPPEIHWDGKQSRDFLYVDNVVYANLRAMASASDLSGEAFNIGVQEDYSVLDLFHALRKILKAPSIQPHFSAKRPGDVRRTLASIVKAKRLLKFKVQTPFYEGLEKTAAWFVSRQHLRSH